MAAKAIVKFIGNNQELEIEESVAQSNEQLNRVLVLLYPNMANAEIRRETDKDGRLIVSVVKQAGSKGLLPSITPLTTSIISPDNGDGDGENWATQQSQAKKILTCLTDPATPEQLNPTLLLAWQTRQLEIAGKLDLTTLLAMQPRLKAAIEAGLAEQARVDNSLSTLKAASAVACVGFVFPGF